MPADPPAGRSAALVWNTRKTDGSPFLRAYEGLLNEFGTDYGAVRHDRNEASRRTVFFPRGYRARSRSPTPSASTAPACAAACCPRPTPPAPTTPAAPKCSPPWIGCSTPTSRDGTVTIDYDTELYHGTPYVVKAVNSPLLPLQNVQAVGPGPLRCARVPAPDGSCLPVGRACRVEKDPREVEMRFVCRRTARAAWSFVAAGSPSRRGFGPRTAQRRPAAASPRATIAVHLKPVATGMAAPDYAISAPGDTNRLFVVEQNGLLRIHPERHAAARRGARHPEPRAAAARSRPTPTTSAASSAWRSTPASTTREPRLPHALHVHQRADPATARRRPIAAPNGATQNYRR